ncbi:glycoside hydrolase family 5 protein [Sphingobacterium corticis]|uniref:Glycoside hydrolase family 5 protein n=1 Tax=Sphingobacterium corticis TaxID=1812823 RepID=A0ABW5NJY3_9SPHI
MNKQMSFLFAIALTVFGACKAENMKKTESVDSVEKVLSTKPDKASTPFGINGRLTLSGTQIVNQFGKAVQLRGMSTHGLQYRGNCYTDESLELLAYGWGADILRISMYVQEGGYETNPEKFTQMVDNLVEKCYEMGIYALIDWHMLHPGDPNANTELAKVFFEHVSKKHADKGNVLYEICNEPNDKEGVVTWAMIKNYANQIIPIVRNNDPKSIIIVGTPENASRPDMAIGNPLTQANVMYTMHFYAADTWQSNHQQRRRDYVSKAIAAGLPVFVTEFGTQDGWGDGENDFVASQLWLDFMRTNKISWCNWNYSDSPLSGAVWKNGTCPNGPWTDDNLKESGKWIRGKLSNPADEFATQ